MIEEYITNNPTHKLTITIKHKQGTEHTTYALNPFTKLVNIESHTITATVYGHKRTLDIKDGQSVSEALAEQKRHWKRYYKEQRSNWSDEQKEANNRRQREYQERRRAQQQ